MPPKGHAVLSASSSERWLNCTPSARLCEAYEDKSSDYAAEGTDSHALCEFRLKQALGIPAENPIENLSWYNEEMEDCAAGYGYIEKFIENLGERFNIREIAFDRWGAVQMVQNLEGMGFTPTAGIPSSAG